MRRVIILCFFTILSLTVWSESQDKNVDYLGVAAILIRDGNYERAEDTLSNVDIDNEDIDLNRFYTLKGLIDLRMGRYEDSLKNFNQANTIGEPNPVIYAYIAQSYFALEEYESSISAIDKVPNIRLFPDLYGLKSQAYWFLDKKTEAFTTLEEGITIFPDKLNLQQQKLTYFIELELTQTALECSKSILEREKNDPELYLAIAESFRKGKISEEAALIMEEAHIKFPDNSRVLLMMAQCYVDMERYLTAAGIVEKVAAQDKKYLKDSADLFIEAGNIHRAAYINYQISDSDIKSKLRFNLLLALERFEEALAIIPRLERTGLLEDENLLYASAYVYFKVQKYGEAVEYLNRIRGERLFRQATKLRKAIKVMESEDIPLL